MEILIKRFLEEKINGKSDNRTDNRIGQTVQIPSKNGGSSFTKREFILDATTYDPYTGERSEYENIIPLEFRVTSVQNLTALIRVMLLLYHCLTRAFLDESRRRIQTYGIHSML